jgi:hypothetical protein
MARDRIYQPMTTAVGDLAIGVMKVSVGPKQDLQAAAGGSMTTLGSLKDATLSMKPTFKEHKTAYPQILDFKIAELLAANYKCGVEEIGAAQTISLLGECLNTLNTGTAYYHSIEAVSEFANGGTLKMFTPYAQIKPTLNLNFGDDFTSIPFEFEALTNPAYTNKDLVYRSRVAAAVAGTRSLTNQAVTQNVENLGIGMFQVRIGTATFNEPTGVTSVTPVTDAAGLTPMSEAQSVGAIKSADFQTNPTFKEHFSGFPKVKDLIMLESSTITVSTALEQISAALAAPLVKGAATTPWDMLFDASVNGSLYYVPVEITANLVTGGVLSLWMPNCQIIPEADYAPGNDWASMPFKLEAQIQTGVDRVYMTYTAP